MERISLLQDIYEYVKKRYKSEPEYLWQRLPGYAVLRHTENKNRYEVIMNVPMKNLVFRTADVFLIKRECS